MTKNSEKNSYEKKYDQFEMLNEYWVDLQKLDRKLRYVPSGKETDKSAAQERTKARDAVLGIAHLQPNAPDYLVEAELARHITRAREDALNYFKENGRDAIRGMNRDVLEDRVYTITPEATGDERHDTIAQAHSAFLTYQNFVSKYAQGEKIDERAEDELKAYAAEKEGKEAREKAKKDGRSKLVQDLDYIAAKYRAFNNLPRKAVANHCVELLKDLKKKMDELFTPQYRKADYASETLTYHVEKLLDEYEDEEEEDEKAKEKDEDEEDEDKAERHDKFRDDRRDARNVKVWEFMQYMHQIIDY